MRLEIEPRVTSYPLGTDQIADDTFSSAAWDFDSLLKKGIAAAQSGDRDHARKLLSQATAVNPASEDAWMWLASISDYPEELLAFLNRVLEINPENEKAVEWRVATNSLLAKTFVQRALAARSDGSVELAEQCLSQALSYDSSCEAAWFWKASLADADDEKLEFYAKVLEINPENTDAAKAVEKIDMDRALSSLNSAKAYASDGEVSSAFAILRQLENHNSAEIREMAYLTMADVAETDDEKLEFFSHVLDLNPQNENAADAINAIKSNRSQAAFDEARSAAAVGDNDSAIKILDAYLEEVPGSVDAWLLRSHLSVSLDKKIEALENALLIEPSNAAARSGLSFLALTFGAKESAESLDATPAAETPFEEPAAQFVQPEFEETEVAENADWNAPVDTVDVQHLVPAEEYSYDPTAEPAASEDSVYEQETTFTSAMPELAMAREYSENGHSSTAENLGDYSNGYYNGVTSAPEPEPEPETESDPRSFVDDPWAAETPVEPFADDMVSHGAVSSTACPFCAEMNDPQAFECESCAASLTLSDIETLLSGSRADKDVVQQSVTAMEAEWNMREFTEAELTVLGLGHLNLGNFDNGFRYLQEASRLNPNNVILAGQVNTIAIRLDEMRRQSEHHENMPRGKRILVVDDSPTVRKLIAGKLEKSGHNVVCAVDGVDALAKLEDGMPDLVLLDITMPRMDGYEVCRQIRSTPAGKDLPVVMISGKDGFFDKVRGRMAGTTGYVTKPFGPETLMKALETYLLPEEPEAELS